MGISKFPDPSSDKPTFLNLFSFLKNSKKTNKNSPPWMRLYRRFTVKDLSTATDDFGMKIGEGGFSTLYKGFIGGSYKQTVAVQRFKTEQDRRYLYFLREMELLSKRDHPNIVSVIGYCLDGLESDPFIVYEYMPHGTLYDQLHSRNDAKTPLSWKKRLEICIGAARGLEFLHTGNPSIIHRDIKTSNIHLDQNWFAKILDFQLSKLVPVGLSESDSHVSTILAGTLGYIDPEYLSTGHLSMKSDVYSFGVVLFEVLSARKVTGSVLPEEVELSLVPWCRQCVEDGKLDEIIDPCLKDEIASECLKAYVDIAYKCTNDSRHERPTMADVVKRLELTLLLQECIEAGVPFSPSWLRSIVPPPKTSSWLRSNAPHTMRSEPSVEMEIQDSDLSVSGYDSEELLRD